MYGFIAATRTSGKLCSDLSWSWRRVSERRLSGDTSLLPRHTRSMNIYVEPTTRGSCSGCENCGNSSWLDIGVRTVGGKRSRKKCRRSSLVDATHEMLNGAGLYDGAIGETHSIFGGVLRNDARFCHNFRAECLRYRISTIGCECTTMEMVCLHVQLRLHPYRRFGSSEYSAANITS